MVDIQYLLTLSPRLDRFKKKSNNLYNFRCPYCGDSQKKQSKARGFVYSMKNEYFFKCHNCSKGTTLGKLIEHIDPQLYREYGYREYVLFGGWANSSTASVVWANREQNTSVYCLYRSDQSDCAKVSR